MENERSERSRDIPNALVLMATITTVAGCVVLGATVHVAWYALAVTALSVGISLAPKYGPGHPERWNMPDAPIQAVGLGAIPTSVALGSVSGNWWWLAGGALVMVLAAVVSNELEKPKATGR